MDAWLVRPPLLVTIQIAFLSMAFQSGLVMSATMMSHMACNRVLASPLRGRAASVEDPAKGFLPSTGRLVRYQPPVEGWTDDGTANGRRGVDGVRVDDGVYEGGEVSMFYDPMIAKLVTWAPTRDEAADLQIAALDAFEIEGLAVEVEDDRRTGHAEQPAEQAALVMVPIALAGVVTGQLFEQVPLHCSVIIDEAPQPQWRQK